MYGPPGNGKSSISNGIRDALGDVAQTYEAEGGGSVTLVFAASSAIARQVDRGAPADVVLLADADWAAWLVQRGAVDTVVPFAGNRLVLVGRQADPFEIDDLPTRLGDGFLATAQVDAVPAGRYAKAALDAAGLWDTLAPRTVQAANVRAALRFVQRGEAPFGIGYASDLVALPDLAALYVFPADSHPAIVYSGASMTAQGSDFMDYLLEPDAQGTLSHWGFLPAGVQ